HTGRAALDAQGRCHHLTTLVEEVVAHSSNGDLRATGFRGSPDSRLFLHLVERAIREAGRADRHVAVLHIDVHRIRALTANALSSDAAELLLASVAARIREGVRSSDPIEIAGETSPNPVIARWAGEHLTVLLPSLAQLSDASKVAARVLDLLARPITVAGRELCVPASIGIAGFPEDHHTAEELVRRAETASCCARESGSGVAKFYDASLDAAALERLTLESALRRALERNEFTLNFQPRVATGTGEIVAFEALLRWKHPELGFVPPSQFIPVAEESGLIVGIGKWVLEEACRQNRRWQDAGLTPVKMAVNLSSVQFVHPAILEQVEETLESTGLDARWLELELTETTAMNDAGRAVEVLRKLKALGLEISIDDFGTGYSSLAYLKRFPIDALKIDRSFIAECPDNPEDSAIVTSIVRMARSLGLEVVAEGVENERQLEFLRELDCEEVQGFLFSQAVSAAQAEALLSGGLRPQSQAA
ncbi:MAG: GGDEF domain-containing phosphodiesterase, partial [Planctomycetota bacterium]|nr:GGDEF domain-containing phosphodiesterase [Planctomycetota bacterium]